jgi:hypothetical protein
MHLPVWLRQGDLEAHGALEKVREAQKKRKLSWDLKKEGFIWEVIVPNFF